MNNLQNAIQRGPSVLVRTPSWHSLCASAHSIQRLAVPADHEVVGFPHLASPIGSWVPELLALQRPEIPNAWRCPDKVINETYVQRFFILLTPWQQFFIFHPELITPFETFLDGIFELRRVVKENLIMDGFWNILGRRRFKLIFLYVSNNRKEGISRTHLQWKMIYFVSKNCIFALHFQYFRFPDLGYGIPLIWIRNMPAILLVWWAL